MTAQSATINQKQLLKQYNLLTYTTLALVFLFIMTQSALAEDISNNAMGFALCNIVTMVYGNIGRGLATLAVIIIGVGATLGKTSWGLAMTVAVGIAVIFNAHRIVGYLGSGAAGCNIAG